MAGRSGLRVAGAVAATAVLLAGAATVPAAADAAISCSYQVTSWSGGFLANLTIVNNGPVINGWTVRMTFPGPTTLLTVWRAVISQGSPFDMFATSLPFDEVISPGQMETFGWTATSADSGVPTVVTVNGTRC
jgi:endo-1,4-beta-xylanase